MAVISVEQCGCRSHSAALAFSCSDFSAYWKSIMLIIHSCATQAYPGPVVVLPEPAVSSKGLPSFVWKTAARDKSELRFRSILVSYTHAMSPAAKCNVWSACHTCWTCKIQCTLHCCRCLWQTEHCLLFCFCSMATTLKDTRRCCSVTILRCSERLLQHRGR